MLYIDKISYINNNKKFLTFFYQGRYKYRSGVQKSQHQQQKRHWKSKAQGD
jgi:hypothetical protein